LSLPALEYLLTHPSCGHKYGFSPVCVNSWACKWPFVMNCCLQSPHTNGLSPVWVLIWVFRFPVSENSFKQRSKGQSKSFFSSLGLFTFSMTAKGWMDYESMDTWRKTNSLEILIVLSKSTKWGTAWCLTLSLFIRIFIKKQNRYYLEVDIICI
jgi:hypothetical protein